MLMMDVLYNSMIHIISMELSMKIALNLVQFATIDNNEISYWMPNVGYNQMTNKYYMVYWSGHYGFKNNQVAVAVADNATGPFVNIAPISMIGAKIISDTTASIVDDDNTAYKFDTIPVILH